MPADRETWAAAFAEQARSDWRLFEDILPSHAEVELCHRLHYLQMASEKIAKAYRLRDTGLDLDEAVSHHVGLARFVRSYLNAPRVRNRYDGHGEQFQHLARFAYLLARDIERLAPAVDPDRAPANVEYPWLAGDDVRVPCRESFPEMARLVSPQGRNLIKFLKQAITEFDTTTIA